MDKGIRFQKEIAMGVASKAETTPGNLKKNLKKGGVVKAAPKKCSCGGIMKGKK